jgi:hypothetical protein
MKTDSAHYMAARRARSASLLINVTSAAWFAFAFTACAAPAKKTSQPAPSLVPAPRPPASAAAAAPAAPCPAESGSYEPRPASSVAVQLPEVPALPDRPVKAGDAYTVWGASYFLRSRAHRAEVSGAKITIEGYIVKTNLADAPRCAVHAGGRADPANCKAPIPTFWIADTPTASVRDSIRVMGWASNFAQIYDAIHAFDSGSEEFEDVFWGTKLPNPLPAVGAKVSVTGAYGVVFSMTAASAEADPVMGVLRYQELRYLEEPPQLASLPGVRRVKKQ